MCHWSILMHHVVALREAALGELGHLHLHHVPPNITMCVYI